MPEYVVSPVSSCKGIMEVCKVAPVELFGFRVIDSTVLKFILNFSIFIQN